MDQDYEILFAYLNERFKIIRSRVLASFSDFTIDGIDKKAASHNISIATASRVFSGKSDPGSDWYMSLLEANNIGMELVKEMVYGKSVTMEKIRQRIDPQGIRSADPKILVCAFDSQRKRLQAYLKYGFYLHWEKDLKTMTVLKKLQDVEYLLLYNETRPNAARIIPVINDKEDGMRQTCVVSSKDLKKEDCKDMALTHLEYAKFHIDTTDMSYICDIDMELVLKHLNRAESKTPVLVSLSKLLATQQPATAKQATIHPITTTALSARKVADDGKRLK